MSCWHRVLRNVTPMFVGSFRRFPFGQSVIRTKLLPNQNLAKELQVARANNGNHSATNHQRNRAARLILENPVCVSRQADRQTQTDRRFEIARRHQISQNRGKRSRFPATPRRIAQCTSVSMATKDKKWRRRGSNSQPPACKAGALPVELRPRGAVPNHSTRRNRSQFSNEMRIDLPTSGVWQMP
jgi:hypothetical protein